MGVCCLFIQWESGTINQNITLIQNPGFPSELTEPSNIKYTVERSSSGKETSCFCGKKHRKIPFPEVCMLRLDFDIFAIMGTGGTAQPNEGVCSRDTFTVTVRHENALIVKLFFLVSRFYQFCMYRLLLL